MFNDVSSSQALTSGTFTDNSASAYGGGEYNDRSRPILIDCTFTECCQVDPPRSIIHLRGNDYDSSCDDCRGNVDCRKDAVDAEDLGYVLLRWGGTNYPECDLAGDGVIRAGDLGLLFAA